MQLPIRMKVTVMMTLLAIASFAILADGQDCGMGPAKKRAIRKMSWKGMGRIMGGEPVDCTVVPWQARVQIVRDDGTYRICGGSIIGDRYILTAAHCVNGRNARHLRVILGDYDHNIIDVNKETFRVRRIMKHDDWDEETKDGDIAILNLTRRIHFDNPCKQKICRNPDFQFNGRSCIVSGWGGEQSSANPADSGPLQMVEVETYDGSYCEDVFEIDDENYIPFEEKMICAGHTEGGRDACEGDSGGPLVCLDEEINRYVQVGIVSYGPELSCGVSNRPGVYTSVAYYNDWINGIIG